VSGIADRQAARIPTAPGLYSRIFENVDTGGEGKVLVPVKVLAAWIETNILLDLAAALFDRHDASLLPSYPIGS